MLLIAVIVVAALAPPRGPPRRARRAARVVVCLVPGLTWKDMEAPELPQPARALLDESAVANVATRVTSVVSEPGEAYLTLGTGTRAVAPREVAGMSFQADEPFGPTTAGEEYVRQHGRSTDAEVVSLGWTLLERRQRGRRVRRHDRRARAGAGRRGAWAAGWSPTPTAPTRWCPASRSTVRRRWRWPTTSGATACGAGGPVLLTADDAAPFGVRLDQAAVLEAFDRCSTPGSVVLVEASDLRRALAFRPRATRSSPRRPARQALASTDALAGAILERLDPERDAVVVVAPTTQPDPGPRRARHPRRRARAGVPHLRQHPARRLRAPHGPGPDDRRARGRGARRGEHRGTRRRATRRSRHRRPRVAPSWSTRRRPPSSATECSTPWC